MYRISDTAFEQFRETFTHLIDGAVREQKAPVKDIFASSPVYEIDCNENPHLYYNFQFGRYKITIARRGRTHQYSIWSDKWIPQIKPFGKAGFNANFYGDYTMLSDAISDFFLTCKNCMNYILGHPAETNQLDLF